MVRGGRGGSQCGLTIKQQQLQAGRPCGKVPYQGQSIKASSCMSVTQWIYSIPVDASVCDVCISSLMMWGEVEDLTCLG
eukprot:28467-Eustigmatos_ZCMA.PRE.1